MIINTKKHREFLINFAYYSLLIVLTYFFLKYLFRYCWPFIVGWLLASLAISLNKKINKKYHLPKITNTISLLLVYVVLGGLLILIGMFTIKFIVNFNYLGFFEKNIAPALENIKNVFINLIDNIGIDIDSSWDQLVTNVMSEISSFLRSVITSIGSLVTKTPTMIIEGIMLVIASFYFIYDYDSAINGIKKILTPRMLSICEHTKEFAIRIVFKCIKAYIIIMAMTFVELFISLKILGMKNVLLLALAITICDILPVLGVGTVYIPWGVILLLLGEVPKGLGMLTAYFIITFVRNFVEPKLVGTQIDLHPLTSLVSIFVGTKIMGLSGALLVPLLVALLKYLYKKNDFFQG